MPPSDNETEAYGEPLVIILLGFVQSMVPTDELLAAVNGYLVILGVTEGHEDTATKFPMLPWHIVVGFVEGGRFSDTVIDLSALQQPVALRALK
jgi:hypothetical protein